MSEDVMPAHLTYGLYGYFVKFIAATAATLITVTLFTGGASL
jgi:hypothetical protein